MQRTRTGRTFFFITDTTDFVVQRLQQSRGMSTAQQDKSALYRFLFVAGNQRQSITIHFLEVRNDFAQRTPEHILPVFVLRQDLFYVFSHGDTPLLSGRQGAAWSGVPRKLDRRRATRRLNESCSAAPDP